MDTLALLSIGFAGAAGLTVGFRKHWEITCIAACLAVPAIASSIHAIRLHAPETMDTAGWALMTFLQLFILASLAWILCAGLHHLVRHIYSGIVKRSGGNA